jgi:hypothetical protein
MANLDKNRIDPIPLRMSSALTVDKQTQGRTFGDRLHYGLNQAAGVIVNAASAAGTLLGAPIVSTAISQVANLGGMPGTTLGGTVGGQYGGVANAAFGISSQITPGLVQASSGYAAGPIASGGLGGLGGSTSLASSGLVGTNTGGTTNSSVTPGGSLTNPLSTTVGGTGTAGGYQNYFSSLGQEQYRMLNLQIAMQQEYQFFATLSNVLKTRYDTVKAAISNIR